jgi:hypothetical protein
MAHQWAARGVRFDPEGVAPFHFESLRPWLARVLRCAMSQRNTRNLPSSYIWQALGRVTNSGLRRNDLAMQHTLLKREGVELHPLLHAAGSFVCKYGHIPMGQSG